MGGAHQLCQPKTRLELRTMHSAKRHQRLHLLRREFLLMKDDQATYVHPPTSRRQFLARLAAGTAALTVLNVGNVSHVLAANERAGVYGLGPQNGVDANKRLIIGILTLVLPRAIAVRTSDGSVQEISVIGDTDICRGACH
jgi:hypothetical protein